MFLFSIKRGWGATKEIASCLYKSHCQLFSWTEKNNIKIFTNNSPDDRLILRKISKEVCFPLDKDSLDIVQKMKEKRRDLKDFVGISAPQIGSLLRIILIEIPKELCLVDPSAESPMPLTFLINPDYKPIKKYGLSKDWEGCYSVPDMFGEVWRFNSIEYTSYNLNGVLSKKIANGLLARLIQHEVDHLNGRLFVDILAKGSQLLPKSQLININNSECKPKF